MVSFQHVVARMLFFTLPKLTCDYCCLGFGCNKPQPTLTACTRGGPQRYAYHRINHCHSRAHTPHRSPYVWSCTVALSTSPRVVGLSAPCSHPTPRSRSFVRSFVRSFACALPKTLKTMRLAENDVVVVVCVRALVCACSKTVQQRRGSEQCNNAPTAQHKIRIRSQRRRASKPTSQVTKCRTDKVNERTNDRRSLIDRQRNSAQPKSEGRSVGRWVGWLVVGRSLGKKAQQRKAKPTRLY